MVVNYVPIYLNTGIYSKQLMKSGGKWWIPKEQHELNMAHNQGALTLNSDIKFMNY